MYSCKRVAATETTEVVTVVERAAVARVVALGVAATALAAERAEA
jgi:hypothetical protein